MISKPNRLKVSVIRNNNRKDIVYEDVVSVEHDIISQTVFFVKYNWQWLMTSLAIPLAVFLYAQRKKKRKRKGKEKYSG